jgi:hypothetical protein
MPRAFSGLMAYKDEVVHLSRAGAGAERTYVHAASGNYFTVLGAQPFLGRLFLPNEGRQPGTDPIVVLRTTHGKAVSPPTRVPSASRSSSTVSRSR